MAPSCTEFRHRHRHAFLEPDRHGAVPEKYHRDAFHIGVATVNHVEALISWNYKHIVRRKTREVVRMVNALYNYPFIEIMSPPEILGGEEE